MLCSLATIVIMAATAYTPRMSETDSTPWLTACGTRPQIGTVAISQDFFRTPGFGCGDIILVNGQRFVVNDTMHPRIRQTVDVWMPTVAEAKRFGRRSAVVCRT